MSARRAQWLIIGLSSLLLAPTLAGAPFSDDVWLMQRRALDESAYSFSTTANTEVRPWWSDSDVKITFHRPLTTALFRMEEPLFGQGAVARHAVELLLWAALLLVVASLFERLAPTPRAAWLALAVFALAESRVLLVGWISCRHHLLGAVLGLAAVLQWDRYRRTQDVTRAVLAMVTFAASLFASESALGVIFFLAAIEWLRPAPSPRPLRRMLAIVPFFALELGYLWIYHAHGFGSSGSGSYTDPLASPLAWIGAASARLPLLAAGVLWGLPLDLAMFTRLGPWLLGLAVVLTLPLVPALIAVGRRHPAVGLFACAALAAALPLTASLPSARLLALPGVGGALAVGTLLDDAWTRRRGVAGWLLGFRHLILAPLVLPILAVAFAASTRVTARALFDSPWPETTAQGVLLRMGDPIPHLALGAYLRNRLARPPIILFATPHPIRVTRTSAQTIEADVRCGGLLDTPIELNVGNHGVPQGAIVERLWYRVTVLAANGLHPTRLRIDFKKPLDRLWFATWNDEDERYRPVALPPVGGTMELAGSPLGFGWFRVAAKPCAD